ncbi:MAG: hypothetical protein E6K81_11845 [Candidatus Eisenbacteria bacterium]|uniref:Uncharacterized protein n=1 Tax=Eiseniibacteriota bacterium TaxID=2212470 RepID=A0A538U4E4_UNCEI|nr:MAG: hypothetical protein E6K81_11845 [Candidatus Eisenbacteria bacterium]
MRSMKVVLPVLLMAATLQATTAQAAGTWTLGSNFGLGVISSGGESVTTFGVPNGGGLFLGSVQPGMRIGFIVPSGEYDVYLDTGLNVVSGSNETIHSLITTFNGQYNFSSGLDTTPFVTGGIGFARIGGGGGSDTEALLGGGFGVRRKIGGDHGAFRAEIRYDRLRLSDGANCFGIKLGVDVWVP